MRKVLLFAALMALVATPAYGQSIRIISPGGGSGSSSTCLLCLESDGTGFPITENTQLAANGIALSLSDTGTALTLSRPTASSARYFLIEATGAAAGDAFRMHNFAHPTGSSAIPDGYNIFIGNGAGNLTLGSTATGTLSASGNVGVGASTLAALTGGNNNAARDNVAIGRSAGLSITTGFQNVLIGSYAGDALTISESQTAVGYNSLSAAVSGLGNTALGFAALTSLSGGNNNTNAKNVAVGYSAGSLIAAGTALTVSNESVFLGALTRANANSETNQIVIGANAVGKGSNTVVLGDDNVTDVWASEDAGATLYAGAVSIGASGPTISAGTGDPESVVTAVVGSLFMRTDGGAGTTLYVKESGTGDTGWVAK